MICNRCTGTVAVKWNEDLSVDDVKNLTLMFVDPNRMFYVSMNWLLNRRFRIGQYFITEELVLLDITPRDC